MSQPNSVSTRVPLIVAAAAALIVAALVVTFVHVHTVSEHHRTAAKGYGLTADQQSAVTAAATEAANVVTFSRKTFDQDFARALAGATGSLKTDLGGKEALTRTTLTEGKFDLKGTVGASAYVGQTDDGTGVQVLVTINGFKVADTASGSSSSVQRLELTMTKVGKAWLASALTAVGIQ